METWASRAPRDWAPSAEEADPTRHTQEEEGGQLRRHPSEEAACSRTARTATLQPERGGRSSLDGYGRGLCCLSHLLGGLPRLSNGSREEWRADPKREPYGLEEEGPGRTGRRDRRLGLRSSRSV